MNEWFEWLLKSKEKASMLRKLFLLFYLTHMAIPWFLSYLGLLCISWFCISDIYKMFAVSIGAICFVFMIFNLGRERYEVQELRDLYFTFSGNFEKDWS